MIGICKNIFEPLSLAFAADAISTSRDDGSRFLSSGGCEADAALGLTIGGLRNPLPPRLICYFESRLRGESLLLQARRQQTCGGSIGEGCGR